MNPILIVEAAVRYWEDAEINGVQIPEEGEGTPFKVGELWKPRIDLVEGRFLDWPEGTTAHFHYKVCDTGEYWIEQEGKRLKWNGYYVPDDFLCVGDSGYGDYIILDVAKDGTIPGWKQPEIDEEKWEEEQP